MLIAALWPALAAGFAVAFGADASPCPYTSVVLNSFPLEHAALPPDQCAFMTSLEEPLRRIVAAASIDPAGIVLDHALSPGTAADAGYDDKRGIAVTGGFASCLLGDRPAAIGMLCHEVGHAVQYRGADPAAREALVRLRSGYRDDPAYAAGSRELEREADTIGRELCARAGFPLDVEAFPKALARCNGGGPPSTALPDHPSDAERLQAARADAAHLSEQRAREVGAAIQRRARRLMAGAPSAEDDAPLDLSLSPRAWALTPAADKDRLRAPYRPSVTYDSPELLGEPSH